MALRPKTKVKPIPTIDALQCLAKTWRDQYGKLLAGRCVYDHSLIVGKIAEIVINTFPAVLRNALFPPGSVLIAASHDIGKISPTFLLRLLMALNQVSSPLAQQLLTLLGFSAEEAATRSREMEQDWSGHAGVSAVALSEFTDNRYCPIVVGQHHGRRAKTSTKKISDTVFGGDTWQAQRRKVIHQLQAEFGADWPQIKSIAQCQLLSGLTTVADWIGSGSAFDDPALPWQTQLPKALADSGLGAPQYINNLTFGDLFRDQNGQPFTPNAAQQQLYHAVNGPGVYVLEAPMGFGKTEAALYAAYKMLAAGQAAGIYFALPTQLTSDKIYARFGAFLQTILAPDSPHRQALLLHGKADLHLLEMGEQGQPGGSWFASRKRGLLAPFAVGTLDQALLAAMNVKHGFVRAFGLAGKVVILDEVHSYDVYTSLIMQDLVSMLRELHCTVIILSATLTQSRRAKLLAQPASDATAYPLISAQPQLSADVTYLPLPPPASKRVALHIAAFDGAGAQEEALLRAEQGQQVLWIENTVDAAQQRYLEIAARAQEIGVECGLLHSRFTQAHRAEKEQHWVTLYGKPGWAQRGERGRILIGTQVLEQSLDIDADFLVSRFAPTDLLLQRLGRLWRHTNTPRPAEARCEAWILAPALERAIADPYNAFSKSAWVYAPYTLCRALEVWRDKTEVCLPDDIRNLLEASYCEREETGTLATLKSELLHGQKNTAGNKPGRKGIDQLESLARLTLIGDSKVESDVDAKTRYSEQDSTTFLLLSQVDYREQQKITRLQLLSGTWLEIPWQRHRLDKTQWQRLALDLERECVSLPQPKNNNPTNHDNAGIWSRGLQHLFYAGNTAQDESPEVTVALVTATGDIRVINAQFSTNPKEYRYRRDTGLSITTQE